MKKFIALMVVGLMVLTVGASVVMAGGMEQGKGLMMNCPQQPQLTNEQKQELAPLMQQMFEIRKQVIAKQVQWGNLTQEQADQIISHMQAKFDQNQGMGMLMMGGGHDRHGHGMGHGQGMGQGQCPQGQQNNGDTAPQQ